MTHPNDSREARRLLSAARELRGLVMGMQAEAHPGFGPLRRRVRAAIGRNNTPDLFVRLSEALFDQGNLKMGDVSGRLGMPASTATRLVDRLEAAGYVRRTLDPGDRRVIRLSLTSRGEAIHRSIEQAWESLAGRLLDALKPDERASLLELVDRIVQIMKGGPASNPGVRAHGGSDR